MSLLSAPMSMDCGSVLPEIFNNMTAPTSIINAKVPAMHHNGWAFSSESRPVLPLCGVVYLLAGCSSGKAVSIGARTGRLHCLHLPSFPAFLLRTFSNSPHSLHLNLIGNFRISYCS